MFWRCISTQTDFVCLQQGCTSLAKMWQNKSISYAAAVECYTIIVQLLQEASVCLSVCLYHITVVVINYSRYTVQMDRVISLIILPPKISNLQPFRFPIFALDCYNYSLMQFDLKKTFQVTTLRLCVELTTASEEGSFYWSIISTSRYKMASSSTKFKSSDH